MAFLMVERGPDSGIQFIIKDFPVNIGRDDENQLVLTDQEVSRFHIRIKKRGKMYIIEDLESKNGCYLNGDRIVNSIIQNGDRILLGDSEIVFFSETENIDIAKEFLNFSMINDKSTGIEGPISVPLDEQIGGFQTIPTSNHSFFQKLYTSFASVRKIYDHLSNLLLVENLEDSCIALLKAIPKFDPFWSRSVMFIWSSSQKKLIPYGTMEYNDTQTSFLINKSALGQCLTLKKGIMATPSVQQKFDRHRVILPMIHSGETIGVIHLESDFIQQKVPLIIVEHIQSLLFRCAANFQTKLLRAEIDAMLIGMVETVVATIEAKDTYTVGHSERVCRFSMGIADELKLNKDTKKMLMISSLCHDIGKIGIPDAILKKATLLNPEEYEEMRLHPTIGANIISHMPNAQKFISGVKYHHEKWDGTGYPDGLVGENIPFFGRIVAVADVFDAMISGRSYSGFIEEADAIEKISKEAELFDPEILKALIKAWENGTITQRTSTFVGKPPKEK